jgi:hypothetical protein
MVFFKTYIDTDKKDFIKALSIYSESIPTDIFTPTNEIIFHLDSQRILRNSKPFLGFLTIYDNNKVIGSIQYVYFYRNNLIFIDYISVKKEERSMYLFFNILFWICFIGNIVETFMMCSLRPLLSF